ncbi:MAG TPA: ATP-binding protein [Methylomirabilota bacterium]|jgi:signal transduction histidine kinase/CheY-like chemotaxis protein|nr:ATP-binding protein [Methylomirabilota bacterium]
MADVTLELIHRLANVLLGVSALTVAALIVVEIGRRPTRRREPLGIAFCIVFLAIGLRAAVRVTFEQVSSVPREAAATVVAIDALAAGATLACLALRRRYGVFIESADIVREYETEYAAKEREAHGLAQVNEELRRLDELKSEFLAMVSHELRTPLTAIVGYGRLLLRQVHGPLNAKQLEHQEAIFRSAQRLTDLINDLLDVSRLEAARIELHPRPTDARQVTDQVIAAVHVAAQAKQIHLLNKLGDSLPLVQADQPRLHQILVNLVANAIKFTPPGGTVRIRGDRHNDQVWIAVEDTGVGIAREELARIWDPFYQVESPMRRRHGGSGLGLAIVRRLVELHGGLVRAESEGAGHGSRFSFTLPIATEALRPEGAPEPEAALEPVLAGREVLIVEDDEASQALMRSVVEDVLGGRARVCADGEEAVREAIERPPALLLLDLMLPRLSGWEVARRLRQHPATRGLLIIAVSALARPQEREAALRAGCDAYISKPFLPDELARVVTTTLLSEGVAWR